MANILYENGFPIKAIVNGKLVDVQEVRHGRWIMPQKYNSEYRCSVCGEITKRNYTPFCGWCGAKMDGNATQHTECVENALDALGHGRSEDERGE